jgi:octaprenyl-diphosphate synthase
MRSMVEGDFAAVTLPGGPAARTRPAGVLAGAPLSRVSTVTDALALVAGDLAEAELALHDLIRSEVAAVPQVAGYLVSAGGKRLRPALTALGARVIGHPRTVHRLMCAGELIHLGSLLHDDVVDDGLVRRDQPATHRVFGNAVTILTGDFCLARAVLLASEEGGHACVTALARAVTEMAEGEVLQLQRAGDLGCDREQYLEVVDKKSAALIAWCAAAAAWAANDLESAAILSEFGRRVGTAFQITDDVLDYQPGTGKLPGADVRERKVTLPLLYAMEARHDLRHELAVEPSRERISGLVAMIRDTGALEAALSDARAMVESALALLSNLPDNNGRAALSALGRHLVERAS